MPRAFQINCLKYLFMFLKEVILHSKTQLIDKVMVSQVQRLVHKKLDNKTVVFKQVKESMKKNFANLKASQQNKIKSNLIGVISRPG